jgi:chaperonin GroES
LHHLPIVGCAFRKVWRSETLGRNKSEMVPAIHLVVNNKCRSLDEAPVVTHEVPIYPQDIEERKRSGVFLDIELPAPQNDGEEADDDAPHLFLEQHCFLDLDEDGYKEPYIVTVHKESCQVVRIVANYRMEAIKDNGKKIIRIPKDQYFVKYSFIPDPKGGFYDIGFGRLLESLGETIDTTINQMLDAGHLQNAGGGFIGTGIRLKEGRADQGFARPL